MFFSKVIRGEFEDDCERCDLGYYCNGIGRIDVVGFCDFGYFCLRGVKIFKLNNDFIGGICFRGSFCLVG